MILPDFTHLAIFGAVFFAVSVFSAAAGMGGGMLVTGVLSTFIPASALIPVQNIILFWSSASRVILYRQAIQWSIAWPIIIGLGLGSFAGAKIYIQLPETWLNILIALVMLYFTWAPTGSQYLTRFVSLRVLVGFFHGFLSSLTGAGGLLQSTFNRMNLQKDARIATFATVISSNNIWRGLAFALLGVSLAPYWAIIALAIPIAVLGSWVGKQIGHCISEALFDHLFKAIITLLALNLLSKSLLPWLHG